MTFLLKASVSLSIIGHDNADLAGLLRLHETPDRNIAGAPDMLAPGGVSSALLEGVVPTSILPP